MLRVGVIGAGLIGARRAEVAAADPSSVVVAIADLDSDRARRVAERVGCPQVREWSDVVCKPVLAHNLELLARHGVRQEEGAKVLMNF